MIWWVVFTIWFVCTQIYLPFKLFMYGKTNNSLILSFGSVFVIFIAFIINNFLLNFTIKLHDKIMEKNK